MHDKINKKLVITNTAYFLLNNVMLLTKKSDNIVVHRL